jgi:hypothetical protein
VHRLVRQRAELGAQRSDHPARQIQVAALGAVEVLLDGFSSFDFLHDTKDVVQFLDGIISSVGP